MTPPIHIIAARSLHGVYAGSGGGLPWRAPADLRHFRMCTLGRTVLMGWRTWESLPGPLQGRQQLVWTTRHGAGTELPGGGTVVASLGDALERTVTEELWAIGGRDVWEAALPHAEVLELTTVHVPVAGRLWVPALHAFELTAETHRRADAANPALTFQAWRRVR